MLVFLLDAAGAFAISRLSGNRLALVAMAVALGLANGLVASALTSMAFGDVMTPDEQARAQMQAAVMHPVVCIALTLWLRIRHERPRRP